jgi:hypothetical protein
VSRKSKHKGKKRKQREVPIMPPQEFPPTASKPSKHGLILTVLGLVLTILGLSALIELFPILSASGSPPLDPNNQLSSSRFTITNDGYLPLTDVMSACFLWKVDQGVDHESDSMERIVVPPESKLAPHEPFTVPCTSENSIITPGQPLTITQADVAIAVYFRPWPFTFLRKHKLLRLVARVGKQGEVVWDRQPAADLEKDYDAFIQKFGGTFPPQFQRQTLPSK